MKFTGEKEKLPKLFERDSKNHMDTQTQSHKTRNTLAKTNSFRGKAADLCLETLKHTIVD